MPTGPTYDRCTDPDAIDMYCIAESRFGSDDDNYHLRISRASGQWFVEPHDGTGTFQQVRDDSDVKIALSDQDACELYKALTSTKFERLVKQLLAGHARGEDKANIVKKIMALTDGVRKIDVVAQEDINADFYEDLLSAEMPASEFDDVKLMVLDDLQNEGKTASFLDIRLALMDAFHDKRGVPTDSESVLYPYW